MVSGIRITSSMAIGESHFLRSLPTASRLRRPLADTKRLCRRPVSAARGLILFLRHQEIEVNDYDIDAVVNMTLHATTCQPRRVGSVAAKALVFYFGEASDPPGDEVRGATLERAARLDKVLAGPAEPKKAPVPAPKGKSKPKPKPSTPAHNTKPARPTTKPKPGPAIKLKVTKPIVLAAVPPPTEEDPSDSDPEQSETRDGNSEASVENAAG